MPFSESQSWIEMERCVLLQVAMESATTVLDDDAVSSAQLKQSLLQEELLIAGVEKEPFEIIFRTLDDNVDETEVVAYMEVWRIEIQTAAEEACQLLKVCVESNSFQPSDTDIMKTWIVSKGKVVSTENAMKKIEDTGSEDYKTLEEELESLRKNADSNSEAVEKACRLKELKDRKFVLSSPKRLSEFARPT